MKKFLFSETTPGVDFAEQYNIYVNGIGAVVDLMKKYENYNIYWTIVC